MVMQCLDDSSLWEKELCLSSVHYGSYTRESWEWEAGLVLPSGMLSLITLSILSSSTDLPPTEFDVVILYGLYHLNYRKKRRSWYMERMYYFEYSTSNSIMKGYHHHHHHHYHRLSPWIRSFDLFRHRRVAIVSWGVQGIWGSLWYILRSWWTTHHWDPKLPIFPRHWNVVESKHSKYILVLISP